MYIGLFCGSFFIDIVSSSMALIISMCIFIQVPFFGSLLYIYVSFVSLFSLI